MNTTSNDNSTPPALILRTFKNAIASNDTKRAEKIIQSAIAAKYPQKLIDSLQARLQSISNELAEQDSSKDKNRRSDFSTIPRVAIVAHCFYLDIWPDVSKRLKSLECHFDLFVTTTSEKIGKVSEMVLRDFSEARIFAAPNKGMDIFPFLSLLPLLHNERYQYVCKIHTKRGDGRLAIVWRDLMLDSLIGSTSNFCSVVSAFEINKKLTIVGPGPLYQSTQKLMLDNKDSVHQIASTIWEDDKALPDDWGFFAGSMFWARVNSLIPLSHHYNMSSSSIGSTYKKDGNIEHGIECIFGLVIAAENGHVGLLYPTKNGSSEQEVITYSADQGIGYAHIGSVMRALEKIAASTDTIINSQLFSRDEYLKDCPELLNTNIDLTFHYLTTGTFKNYWPCLDIPPLNSLRKKAMESATHADLFTYICAQLNSGKTLTELKSEREHSTAYGDKEMHIISSSGFFDEEYYYQQRPDIKNLNLNPIEHYLSRGLFEECYPNRYFIPREYQALNKDIASAHIEPFSHYLTHGAFENRRYRETLKREQEDSPFLRYQVLNQTLINWDQIQHKKRNSSLISIVIPVFNNKHLTLECVTSIIKVNTAMQYEIICVDNGSNSDTKEMLFECKQKYGIVVVENKENYNFALGCNIGFMHSSGDIIVFLNNDTTVTDFWIDELIKPLNDKTIKAVQPRLLYPDLTVQCIGVVFANHQVIGYPIYSGMDAADLSTRKSRRVKAITAACMAVRSTDFAMARGFDPLFINGQEDIDLCLRLCQSSPKSSCYCQATSNVIHYESKTPGRGKFIKLNRVNFANRWRGLALADDFNYYSEDGFEIIDWHRDRREFLDLNIGASRPILQRARISRIKYRWDLPREEQFLCDIYEYHHKHSKVIDDVLISIIMPTKNRASVISKAIRSVLDQTHQNFELLIIDDGSSDSTRDVVSQLTSDNRVKFIPIKSSGVSIARNTGLDAAKGTIVAYLDSDNSWEPFFLQAMTTYLTSTGSFAAYSGLRVLDETGSAVMFRGEVFNWEECLQENYVDINAFAHKKATMRNDPSLRRFVDWDFILRLAKGKAVEFAYFVGVNYYDGDQHKRITKTVSASKNEIQKLKEYVQGKHGKSHFPSASTHNSTLVELNMQELSNYKFLIKTPCRSIGQAQAWGDYHLACSIQKPLRELGLSSEINTLDAWYSSQEDKSIVLVIRGLASYNPRPYDFNILWIISHPDKVTSEELDQYDQIFVASKYYRHILESFTKKPVSVLLQATDPERFNLNVGKMAHHELLFVGNSRSIYRPVVKFLVEGGYDLAIYGLGWENFVDAAHIKGRNILNTELGSYYAGANVVFNDHWQSMSSNGFISNRLYDCVACGSFVISDFVEGIDQIFGQSVYQYKDFSGIKSMLASRERWPTKEVLRSSSEYILANHTYGARMHEMLATIYRPCLNKLSSN